jgi:hypothetical protein
MESVGLITFGGAPEREKGLSEISLISMVGLIRLQTMQAVSGYLPCIE